MRTLIALLLTSAMADQCEVEHEPPPRPRGKLVLHLIKALAPIAVVMALASGAQAVTSEAEKLIQQCRAQEELPFPQQPRFAAHRRVQ
jgi:hypothetical protein